MENILTGVALDPRSSEAKAKDYQAEEIASFAPVNWVEKTPDQFRKFPIRNQDGSLTCVAQTGAKILGIENDLEEKDFIEFSARDIYERRGNKPSGGMWLQDALDIMSKHGATTEARLPSQNMGESQIEAPFTRSNDDLSIAKKYRAGGYVQLPYDIDKIADIILNQKKGVMLFFFFAYDEWTDVPFLKYRDFPSNHANAVRHSVTGVDAILWKGQKAIVIEDSWGKFYGLEGQRIITEEFLKERLFGAGYVLDLSNQPEAIQKPKYTFTKVLNYGMRSQSVTALQDILKYEGLFPANVESTGYYGNITAKAVLAFQRKYKVASETELASLQGRVIGPKTRAKLNLMFSS